MASSNAEYTRITRLVLRLERLDKFQAVAGAQPQRSQQQLRFAFCDLASRARNAVRFAAGNHVRLAIDESDDSVAKQWMLVHDEDSGFSDVFSWRSDAVCCVCFRDLH